MTEEPLVSVIINNYNKAPYLKRCLDSVSNQTYKNIEVIFWDDNSTDNSVDIYWKWKSSLSKRWGGKTLFLSTDKYFYYKNKQLIPLGVTRWMVLQRCTGKYVAILDSDDKWAENKLVLQVASFPYWAGLSFTDCEMVNGETFVTIGETYHDIYPIPNIGCPSSQYRDLLTKYNYMPASTLLFDRKKLLSVIGSPSHYTSGEDYDWVLKVAEKYGCYYYPKPLTYYTVVNNSLTHNKRSSTKATWYEIDAAVNSYNRTKKYKRQFIQHLIWLYCKLIWKQFIREKL